MNEVSKLGSKIEFSVLILNLLVLPSNILTRISLDVFKFNGILNRYRQTWSYEIQIHVINYQDWSMYNLSLQNQYVLSQICKEK